MSSEQDYFAIGPDPLDLLSAYTLATDLSQGAVVCMVGTVRRQTAGRAVSHLEYEAYTPMALEVFKQIATAIRERWPTTGKIVMHHRTGKLALGEASVLVVVGHPHRAAAFDGCKYAIDTLKSDAPIWKKEHWADGASDWVVADSIGAKSQ